MAHGLLVENYSCLCVCKRGGSVPERPTNDEIASLADEIRAYLEAHPNASDSLEGVVTWWLTRQRYKQARDRIQRALVYLVNEGVVKEVRTPGGRTVYSSATRRFLDNNGD